MNVSMNNAFVCDCVFVWACTCVCVSVYVCVVWACTCVCVSEYVCVVWACTCVCVSVCVCCNSNHITLDVQTFFTSADEIASLSRATVVTRLPTDGQTQDILRLIHETLHDAEVSPIWSAYCTSLCHCMFFCAHARALVSAPNWLPNVPQVSSPNACLLHRLGDMPANMRLIFTAKKTEIAQLR